MSPTIEIESPPVEPAEDDTIELHVRKVPRAIWLKARQAALASGLRFGQYMIRLILEKAEPFSPSPRVPYERTPTLDPSVVSTEIQDDPK